MKVLVKLGEHTEYMGWSIFRGAYTSWEDLLSDDLKRVIKWTGGRDGEVRVYKHTTEFEGETLTFVTITLTSIYNFDDSVFADFVENYVNCECNGEGFPSIDFAVKEVEL